MHIPKPVVAVALLVLAALAVAFRPQDKPTLDYGAGAGWAGPHPSQLVHFFVEVPSNAQQELVTWFQRVPGNGLVITRILHETLSESTLEILEGGVTVSRFIGPFVVAPLPIRGGSSLQFRFRAGNNPPPDKSRLHVFGYVW